MEQYMNRCMELALNGLGQTAPNPMVGAVIVADNRIIGEGYHRQCGEAHAEVNAIASVADKSLLKNSTLYVNLEPCSHFGKTPPCADLIIQHQISKVVISNVDPNIKVRGKGIEKLRNAGIEVITDVLKTQGEALNKRFFIYHRKNRPYIILKWAQSGDNFLDIVRYPTDAKRPTWITNEEARMLVHKWRSEEQAILVGTNTAFMDNPQLNVRDWTGKNPLRIVLDRRLRLPKNLNLFNKKIPTLVFTHREMEEQEDGNIEYMTLKQDSYFPENILGELYRRQIQSLIVEGGAKVLNAFLDAQLWDESRVFSGKKYFTEGISAPVMPVPPLYTEHWPDFKLDIFRNNY